MDEKHPIVYPLHGLDDTLLYRALISRLMRFNDVLDADKLHEALLGLFEIGDWRKLGGRLRVKPNGKLEIHVPQTFTEEQRPVAFAHDVFDMRIEDHPVAGQLPTPTDGPSIQPISSLDFRSFVVRWPDHPTTIDEMIQMDAPQLSLHVSSFNNATLVALTWPHTMMDAVGIQALLHAWSLVLAGREDEVAPVFGAHKDVLETIESSHQDKQEDFGPDEQRMTGMGKLKFIFHNLWDRLWNPRWERRAIYLPKDIFFRLKARVQDEAALSTSIEKPFVSDNDTLTAWVTRAMAISMPSPRPVTAVIFSNARFRLPLLLESTGVYLQNMVLAGLAFFPAELARGPLGPIALSNRRHIAAQGTVQQTLAMLRTMRQDIASDKTPNLFYGEPHASVLFVNNVNKLDLIKAPNFGPAVLRQGDGDESRMNPPGAMLIYHNYTIKPLVGGINAVWMLGKDYGGNYWLEGNFLPRTWALLEEELEALKDTI
ncbi:transcriptional regulator sdnM [Penicillium sp. IBT 18751x]|nr:transcriptional regulator sdnM [Penicillium sp. IBT 18751x]